MFNSLLSLFRKNAELISENDSHKEAPQTYDAPNHIFVSPCEAYPLFEVGRKLETDNKKIYVDCFRGESEFPDLDALIEVKHRGEKPLYFWSNEYNRQHLIKDIIYSPYYRNIIQNNTSEQAAKILMQDTHSLKNRMSQNALERAIKEVKNNMESYFVIHLSCFTRLKIGEQIYNGVNALKTESQNPDSSVVQLTQRFPCFDSYDYANEDRFNRTFFFFKQNPEKMKKIENNTFKLSEEYLPVVKYSDGENTMSVMLQEKI